MKIRVAAPLAGIYQDFRAVHTDAAQISDATIRDARQAGAQIIELLNGKQGGIHDGILLLPGAATISVAVDGPQFKTKRERKRLLAAFKQYPDEVFGIAGEFNLGTHQDAAFRSSSTHILARGLTESAVRDSIKAGRYYAAQDWLCDPAGFFFIAENSLGVFDMGDTVPLLRGTRLRVNLPISARVRVESSGATVLDATGHEMSFAVRQPGDYRVGVNLSIDGEEMNWIISSPIHIVEPPPLDPPMGAISESVEVQRAIPYAGDGLEKHKLDLYLPKGKKNFPVMVFLHGGAWNTGDRSMYALFGNRFAKAGIGVAIPSYRLMPQNPYPAQMEDAAAAFAWVYRNAAKFGGDASRVYLAGHSAGGHLASLLALDEDYQRKAGIPSGAIRGVASMSGVYRVGTLAAFQNADDDPSPIDHVHAGAPPFLITYCQWDYFGLPKEARDFTTALEKKFVPARLVFIPGQSHISEILHTLDDDDATARALLDFIR